MSSPNSNPYTGYFCSGCRGTPEDSECVCYATFPSLIEHAKWAHTTNGVPNLSTWLIPIDGPNADPTDITSPVQEDLFFHRWNPHPCMLTIEPPEEDEKARSKSHRGGPEIPMLRNPDGSVVTGPRGHALRDLPLPLYISATVDDAYIEYKHCQIPYLKKSDILDRMRNDLGVTAYTNRRIRYRNGLKEDGGDKGYFIRSPLDQGNDKVTRPLLLMLDSLQQANFDYNTVADVNSGIVTLPRPSSLPLGEIWDPRPINVYRNGIPHRYGSFIGNACRVLSECKILAQSRGCNWRELGKTELQLGGREAL